MANDLAIGLIETDKEKQTLKVEFQLTEMNEIEEYQKAYKEIYGKDIDASIIVNALAMRQLRNDRNFKAWQKSHKAAANNAL